MSVQTSIAKPAAAMPGVLAYPERPRIVSTKVSGETAAIPHGVYVSRDGADDLVDLPAASGDIGTGGVALRDPGAEFVPTGYAEDDVFPVLEEGFVYVEVEDAVTQNGDVYVRHVAAGAEQLGAFRSDADGTDATQLSGAKYVTSAGAGELAIVYLSKA